MRDDDESKEGDCPSIVLYDSQYKAVASWVMQSKSVTEGGPNQWVPKAMVKEMEEWGYGKVLLKSDGEPAVRALKKKVRIRRADEITMMEVTPRGDPKANGEAESAVREIKGVARSIKAGLEQRIKEPLPADSTILLWIV